MRDPDRIPEILAAIEREWKKTPDLRLGQLLIAAMRMKRVADRDEEGKFLFNVEDNRLLEILGEKTDEEVQYILDAPDRARRELSQWVRENPIPKGLSPAETSQWIKENLPSSDTGHNQ